MASYSQTGGPPQSESRRNHGGSDPCPPYTCKNQRTHIGSRRPTPCNELKERLDHGGKFEELAKTHSEDASGSSGGDLGWLSPGDTVPEFDQAMNALQPGQISEPVQSPFGWHLIQVLERRTQDVSQERQRQAARQAIRARKADAAFQEWLQRLRDRAYVEYRLEEG